MIGSVAERKDCHLVEMGLSFLDQARLPKSYWVEAFQTSVYLIKRPPTPVAFKIAFHMGTCRRAPVSVSPPTGDYGGLGF